MINDPYIDLAYKAVENWVKEKEKLTPPDRLPEDMLQNKKGVFVSIKKSGNLRGCMGTFEPTKEKIAEEIINNAISAGCRDPRFPPIEKEELDELEISVDLLSSPQPCEKEDLDPGKYGIIVKKGRRRGLLLPDLKEVNSSEEQLEIARRKAGLKDEKEEELLRFEVERHK